MDFSQGLSHVIAQITGATPPFLVLLPETTALFAPEAQRQ
jgi:hypothetical protein